MVKKKTAALVVAAALIGIIVSIVFFFKKGIPQKGSAKTEALENVLLITLDTTRADRLHCYGYGENCSSNIDRMASEGVCFENAESPVPLTLPSHCTIFTGTYPIFHGVRNNGNYFLHPDQVTLAEVFKENGFQTAAFVSSFTVDSRFGLNQGFDQYDDQLTDDEGSKQYESERAAAGTYEHFRSWLKGHFNQKFFCWVHFYDPHYPYSPPEPFARQYTDHPYDGEIACMDHYVGEILHLLQTLQISSKTMIVAAGDHGEGFGEHRELGHQIFCYEENLHVPLIFFWPGHLPSALRVKERVNLIDIAPTILEICHFRFPSPVQGESLMPALRGKPPAKRDFYFESLFPSEVMGCAPVLGIYHENYKWIDLPQAELYDLIADSGERQNLAGANPRIRLELKKIQKKLVQEYSRENQTNRRALSGAEKDRLASLGYISSSSFADQNSTANLPDPKEKVEAFLQYTSACEELKAGAVEQALKGFEQSLENNLRFAPAYSKLASIHKKKGNLPRALEILQKGIAQMPADNVLKMECASLLVEANRLQEALSMLEKIDIKEAVANQTEINMLYGEIHEKMKNPQLAIDRYRKALDMEPGNRQAQKRLLKLYVSLERPEEALELYYQLERKNSEDRSLIRGIAILNGQLGRFAECERYFEKAISLGADPGIYFEYAVNMSLKKDYAKALALMERFLEQATPAHPQYQLAQKLIQDYQAISNRSH